MAWASSQKELDDLKKLAEQRRQEAEARKQLNVAESRIEIATDQNNVRADKLQMQRQAEHERSMAARQRFADSHAMTAVTQPGRYSPQEAKAARDYLENRGFGSKRYEFNQTQATARHEASEKARGMIGQGSEAAQARAAGDRDVAEIGAASALKQKELETAAQRELGTLDAATKRYAVDAEHGVRNADGTVSEGSRERVERIKGDASVATQREASFGVLGKAEADRQLKREEWEARAKNQLGKNAAQYSSAQVRGMSSIISKAYESALTPEDRAKVTEQLKEQYKNNPLAMSLLGTMGDGEAKEQGGNPAAGASGTGQAQGGNAGPKDGDRIQTKEGWAVRRNGKWVLE